MEFEPVEIIKNLFLGSELHSASRSTLIEHNILRIVNAASPQCANHFESSELEIDYLSLELYDTPADDIAQYFTVTFEFIEQAIMLENPVLVHCKSGNSRAATIVIAFLIKYFGCSLLEAFQHVFRLTSHRCKPNKGFLVQLVEYEKYLFGSSSMEGDFISEIGKTRVLTENKIQLNFESQDRLSDSQEIKIISSKVKECILLRKWSELMQMNQEFRHFSKWQKLLRKILYQVSCEQTNYIIEKIPTPDNPTSLRICNYIDMMKNGISESIGADIQNGFERIFKIAVSYTLSKTNSGVGSIFIEFLSHRILSLYKTMHKDGLKTENLEKEIEEICTHSSQVFGLFCYLKTDPNENSYYEQYQTALAKRLVFYLPVEGSSTSQMLGLELKICKMMINPHHCNRTRSMIEDLKNMQDIYQSWIDQVGSNDEEAVNFKVVLLNSSNWPLNPLLKPLLQNSENSVMDSQLSVESKMIYARNELSTKMPPKNFDFWFSFKNFFEDDLNRKMILLPQLGSAQLAACIGDRQYILEVTTAMMIVLCNFDDLNENQKISFQQLKYNTNFNMKLLSQTLYSLCQSPTRLLCKEDANYQKIDQNDVFWINREFYSKSRKIKIPNKQYNQ